MIQVQAQVQPEQLLRQAMSTFLRAPTNFVTRKLYAEKRLFKEKASSLSKVNIRSKSSGTDGSPQSPWHGHHFRDMEPGCGPNTLRKKEHLKGPIISAFTDLSWKKKSKLILKPQR